MKLIPFKVPLPQIVVVGDAPMCAQCAKETSDLPKYAMIPEEWAYFLGLRDLEGDQLLKSLYV